MERPLTESAILTGQVVLINPFIHEKAKPKLSKETFLEKVKNIQFLRTSQVLNFFSGRFKLQMQLFG